MRGRDLLKRWQELDEIARDRVMQYVLGHADMICESFTDSRERSEYLWARQTLDALEEGISREIGRSKAREICVAEIRKSEALGRRRVALAIAAIIALLALTAWLGGAL